ncbi:hypothetical protein SPRG_15491 [Saprolegnia parasitica CBS 223.65]|uniref:Uncharacterized protein n=1 Tax=Saprolegnia parasitica (strain CBS 223.65) TaxID=695850 RepID=A0A067BYL4_SAPPC|nr:hypothetical protein SPRG_15491 [Saprolegnia parasitica CBS 223.65]KDO19411.1 hypothetical protein SPRG_15491 [Saprolegnia parasitica CBS 223.65]|eukprot:XP_012209878.1 hypothetical protein SPRG_15491 [Saprolegnia parasitica CBS 223.65]
MRIQPTTGLFDLSPRRWRLAGALWLCATLAGSIYYLLLVQPRLANDLLWSNYNASGYQTFLVDALNQLLETTHDASSADLSAVMLEARYDSLLTTAIAHPTLRNMSLDMIEWLPTQYCWVDLDKAFELAHTERRQERCQQQYATNGAVYLEAIFRNIDWDAYIATYGGPNSNFWFAIVSGLEASVRGVRWLQSVATAKTTVADEVAHWQSFGVTGFRFQYQNGHHPGLVETATLVNALGIPTSVTLKSTEPRQGVREVVSFEGDNGTLVLISDAYDSTPSTSSSSSSLSHASAGVYYIVAYSSLVLGAVAVATLIVSAVSHGAVSGNNFFVFNRIAGSTWLGRPLLLLRGASALVLLSSALIGLDRVHNTYAHLELSTCPLLETCFLAWEATWIGYVVHELLLPLQSHRARSIGLLGTSLTWLALVIIDVGWPVNVTATIDRKCTISGIYYNVRCNSVTLQMGQLSRLRVIGLLHFNMTGAHLVLANYFNERSFLKGSVIALTNNQHINALGFFNLSQASVAFPIQQGARVQYSTLTALSDAISGLRTLDECDGPWVFTQYCYLDFDQKWEMANSVTRQERCKAMVHNGAVFLASLLRNVNLTLYWGEEFEIGFGSELRQSTAGQALLATFTPPYLPIDDEAAVWTRKGVTSYTLQWQNYKSIGLTTSYTIVNAYGASYPFALQSTATYARFTSQTSFKMYWSLANDLGSLLENTSTIGGQSLLRPSSRFAYQNASLQEILVTAKVLPVLPWSANYVVLSSYLGPFGSIDTVYISVPSVLQDAIAALDTAVAGARKLNATSYLGISDKFYTFPAPTQWTETIYTVSGSVLCPDQPTAYAAKFYWILAADAFNRDCATSYPALGFVPSRDHILFGVLLAGIGVATNPVDLAQLPTVFALYALQAVRYVTYVMIMLAAVTFVHILLARGHVEGLNMFEMSRVGGIVWVGRPLVAVRSITALCLLSTASIELQSDGVLSYFVTTPIPLWTTCLAANEVTWLVGIVNDISLVWTQDHTIAYATINSLVMWLISALLATLAPVQATIIVSPTCEMATLDYQVVCVAGSVVIGSLERLLTLVGTVLVCNGVCFGLVRCLSKSGPKRLSSSMLLCGGAKYLFEHHDWFLGGVYHLDRASAVLNGLLSVRYQNQWLVFDVKTWCVHTIDVASDLRVRTCENIDLVDRRFGYALPLRK